MRTCICCRFVSFLIAPTNCCLSQMARFPAPKGKQIGRSSPSYVFLTDNDTLVESVAGFFLRMGPAESYSLLKDVS